MSALSFQGLASAWRRAELALSLAAHRLGRVGVLGLGLIVGAGLLYVSTTRPMSQASAALEDELIQRRAALAAEQAKSPEGSATAAKPAAQQPIPARSELPELLRRVYAEAETAGISLDSGRYVIEPEAGGRLVRCSLVLPVSGGYPEIRQFLVAIQEALPSAAIGGFSLSRRTVATDTVEATIRVKLYMRGQQ